MRHLSILIVGLFLMGCIGDCDDAADIYRSFECIIIIENIPNPKSTHLFNIEGTDPYTGKKIQFDRENRWFCTFYPLLAIGDTIIKRKNELVFNIRKKDTIFRFNYECNGKTYE
ncbi:hypothetical protein [Flavobacterium lindanitolerans]|uniref:Lipoprotein n=1 Tax=Flavobacterium lindanitolerans TaxID=428988 RepID=A0A497V818_9FLAO|nr:hypothetical protein [Flavobacterium lindanitolerans]PKW29031.1 hypothetical protein B0G92_0660 [Flavobacterium lindanitolerans]RLJ35466.1 hypothetical protein CLV50_0846 [Flavobacterium lindanitolerans]